MNLKRKNFIRSYTFAFYDVRKQLETFMFVFIKTSRQVTWRKRISVFAEFQYTIHHYFDYVSNSATLLTNLYQVKILNVFR